MISVSRTNYRSKNKERVPYRNQSRHVGVGFCEAGESTHSRRQPRTKLWFTMHVAWAGKLQNTSYLEHFRSIVSSFRNPLVAFYFNALFLSTMCHPVLLHPTNATEALKRQCQQSRFLVQNINNHRDDEDLMFETRNLFCQILEADLASFPIIEWSDAPDVEPPVLLQVKLVSKPKVSKKQKGSSKYRMVRSKSQHQGLSRLGEQACSVQYHCS